MPFQGFVDEFSNSPVQTSEPWFLNIASLSTNIQLEWFFINQNTAYPAAPMIMVTANTSATNAITLPPADRTTAGYSILFINKSGTNFIVRNYAGTTIATITAGTQWYVVFTSNTTEAGTFEVYQLGAGTSTAQASALAGLGLIALSGKLNVNEEVNSYNGTAYTQTTNDRGKLMVWTSGTGTYQCLSAATLGNGFIFAISNQSTVFGQITVLPASGNTIDGGASFTMEVGNSSFFVSDGVSGIYSLGFGRTIIPSASIRTIPVSNITPINLTAQDSEFTIHKFTGTPTVNITVNYPNITQEHVIWNATTGSANTITIKEAGGTNSYSTKSGDIFSVFTDGVEMYEYPNVGTFSSIEFENGTAAAPSITFEQNLAKGFYAPSLNTVATSINGTQIQQWSGTEVLITVPTTLPTGGATLPSYTFSGVLGSGLGYNAGTSEIYVSTANGTQAFKSSNTVTTFALPVTFSGAVTLTTPLGVGSGGTGVTTIPAGSLVYGAGTSPVGNTGSPLGAGYVPISSSATAVGYFPFTGGSVFPSFTGSEMTFNISVTYPGQTSITTLGTVTTGAWQASVIGVPYGGTGANTLTQYGVLAGNGTGAITAITAQTNGQLLIGSTGTFPSAALPTSTGGTLTITPGPGTLNFDLVTPITVSKGGTGVATIPAGSLVYGAGTSPVGNTGSPLGAGYVPISSSATAVGYYPFTGAGIIPTFTGSAMSFAVENYTLVTGWTPTLRFGGGSTGITYTVQSGIFQRFLNQGYFTCRIVLSNKGTSVGAATIAGIPITFPDDQVFSIFVVNLTATTPSGISAVGGSTTSIVNLYKYDSATGNMLTLQDPDFTNTTEIIFSGVIWI